LNCKKLRIYLYIQSIVLTNICSPCLLCRQIKTTQLNMSNCLFCNGELSSHAFQWEGEDNDGNMVWICMDCWDDKVLRQCADCDCLVCCDAIPECNLKIETAESTGMDDDENLYCEKCFEDLAIETDSDEEDDDGEYTIEDATELLDIMSRMK
jgi:hypothetical protein